MAGLGSPGNDSGNGSAGRLLSGDVKDRIIQALLAVIIGSAGAAGYMNVNPPRPDPYTGAMARQDQKEMREYIDGELERLKLRLDVVDRRLELIYEMRQDLAVVREKVSRLESKLNKQ